ncbi:MAG: phage tail tube protein [Burkholderiaceae bacterium]
MARTPSGTLTSVATAFATSRAVSAISNAAEAVCTSAAHGLVVGDIVEIQSGWARLHKRAFRVKTVPDANSFVLELADTSNTNLFPAGGGAGSVRKVNTWVQLSSTMKFSSSGGDPKKVNYKFQESDIEYSLNDGFTPVDRTFEMDADSIGSPGYVALKQLTDVQTDTIIRRVAKSGAVSLLPCTLSLNEEEIEQDGQIVTVRVAVSGNNRTTRYAS